MRIGVITTGVLPIPATKGGAVENLVVNLMDENEKNKLGDKITIYSIYDKQSYEISKKYDKCEFIFYKNNFFAEIIDSSIFWIAKNIFKKKNSQSYRYIVQRLLFLRKVSKDLKNNDYDKLLLENHESEYLALKWHKNYLKYKDKYYYHCHNQLKSCYFCKNIMKETKKFICVSDFIANSVCNFMGIDKSQTVVLRNCINEKNFTKELSIKEHDSFRKKMGFEKDDFVIIFAGRLIPEKGIKELVEAFSLVNIDNIKLMIVGAPIFDLKVKTAYQMQIEQLVEKMKNKIVFTGYINYADIYKYYKISDLAVLPSVWDDPAPLTIIESLTCKLPIITTNSGGIPEYATNGSAIILKRNKHLINNLQNNILKLYNDKNIMKEMSNNCLIASKELTINNYYNNFILIMKNGDINE